MPVELNLGYPVVDITATLRLSGYKTNLLGKGTIGTKVFKGKLDGRRKDVAVKSYKKDLFEYLEEIDILNTAEGHNVVRYFNVFKHPEEHYVAMELCKESLEDWTERMKKLKPTEVKKIEDINILQQCVSGLEFIHDQKIAHRNIRPTNILLLEESKDNVIVKISDFGLIKTTTNTGLNSELQHEYLGWSSQEYLTIGKTDFGAWVAADIFSLGCIFYFVLSKGNHPFGDESGQRGNNITRGNILITSDTPYQHLGSNKLIRLMIDSTPGNRPPLSVVKSHPLFWDAYKIIRFFGAVNDEYYYTYKLWDEANKIFRWHPNPEPFAVQVFKDLEKYGTGRHYGFVFKVNWTHKAQHILNTESSIDYKETMNGLIRAVRNHLVHQKDGRNVKKVTQAKVEDYVGEWLTLFPNLLTCTWIVFEKLKKDFIRIKEFEEFYSKDDPFWNQALRLKLI